MYSWSHWGSSSRLIELQCGLVRSNPYSRKDMLHEPKKLLLNDKFLLLLLELILMGL